MNENQPPEKTKTPVVPATFHVGAILTLAMGMALFPLYLFTLPLSGLYKGGSGGAQQLNMSARDIHSRVSIYPLDYDMKTVSPVFSRAPYFALVKNGNIEKIVENPYKDMPGGASRYLVAYLSQFHPKEVVVRGIGRNAEIALRMYNINVKKLF